MTKYADWNRGQEEALLNKLGGMDVALKLLDCRKVTVEFTEAGAAVVKGQLSPRPTQDRLHRVDTVTLPEHATAFDPHEFFKTRDGLYVWDGFRDRILPVAKKVEAVPASQIASFDLVKPANDGEIHRELPEGYLFEDASAFCAYLAELIEQQKDGGEGTLLNSGYWNIFYVLGANGPVFAVGVYWRSGRRRWDVGAIPLFGGRWGAGDRAFSRTC